MNKQILLYLLACCFVFNSTAQTQTVGKFIHTQDAYDGYTLFAPIRDTGTYLIDNCGRKIHSWSSTTNPGVSVYLLENGNLLKTKKLTNTTFTAGGSGGGMELIDWNSNVIWDYTISSTQECQHHDIEYLPNGNILAIVWELKTQAEATQAGRTTSGSTLWPEKIVEIKPDLVNGGGAVVWQWSVWDHLVQDVDNSKSNFGNVGNSPELVNINFTSGNPTDADWLHINSIDYNAKLDQIVLSIHGFGEFWIIDHSTTTAEAATHTGGNSGKGGDLLYRWGNPQTYNQGTATDQILYKQHDANWIQDGRADSGMIMVFNNQAGTPADYSEVNVIATPIDGTGKYTYTSGAYAPAAPHWTYKAPTPTDFFATNVSGAERMPNGNTLICNGPSGEFFEVDYAGKTVWRYVSPVAGMAGIIAQGSPAVQNIVFRCIKYPTTYAGFAGKTLAPQGYIETGSTYTCDTFNTTSISQQTLTKDIAIYPNPATSHVTISSGTTIDMVYIYNSFGQNMLTNVLHKKQATIDVSMLPSGIYYTVIITEDGRKQTRKTQILQ